MAVDPPPIARRQLPDATQRLLAGLLWLVLATTNLIDHVATVHAVSHGCQEANPLLAGWVDSGRLSRILVLKASMLVVLLVLIRHITGWKLVLLATATGVYLLVATYHLCGTFILERL